MNRPRVIPTLLIDEGNLVKTRKFGNPVYLGDPINAIRIFNEKGVDELAVMDISATCRKSEPDYELLEKMASEAFMPLSYGGGIRSVEQMKHLFRMGFEKIIVNTAFVEDASLIREGAEYFGSQSIVCSIDYKKTLLGKRCFACDGERKIGSSPEELAAIAETSGAGEILLYSMDRDGMRVGYDIDTVTAVSESVGIPVIACGGANDVSDLKKALLAGASAVAAGSMFVFFGKKQAVLINYPEEQELFDGGVYTIR